MNKMNLDIFYPKDQLQIIKIELEEPELHIYMKSRTTGAICPKCGQFTDYYHGTYSRIVQDLPYMGRRIMLHVKAHEYNCVNENCSTSTFAESFADFLHTNRRTTERCAEFVRALALEAGSNGCSRICRRMGIRVAGDTVVRILLRGDMQIFPQGEGTAKQMREWLRNHRRVSSVSCSQADVYVRNLERIIPTLLREPDIHQLRRIAQAEVAEALGLDYPDQEWIQD